MISSIDLQDMLTQHEWTFVDGFDNWPSTIMEIGDQDLLIDFTSLLSWDITITPIIMHRYIAAQAFMRGYSYGANMVHDLIRNEEDYNV